MYKTSKKDLKNVFNKDELFYYFPLLASIPNKFHNKP